MDKNKMTTITEYNQSQAHGLFFNDEIREKVFDLPKLINDTEKYDICCHDNKFDCNENISIKVSGNNNIDCGDILRFYDIDDEQKITIILIRYKQVNTTKQITEILEINYNKELRDILFGTIPRKVLEGYVNYIKSIESLWLIPDSFLHEPVSVEPVEDEKLKWKIIKEFERWFVYSKGDDKRR